MRTGTSERSHQSIYSPSPEPFRQDLSFDFQHWDYAQYGSQSGPLGFPHQFNQPSITAGVTQGNASHEDQQGIWDRSDDPGAHGPLRHSPTGNEARPDGEVQVNTDGANHPSPEPAEGPADTRPYAELLFDCLMSTAPAYEMPLRDIYTWFKTRTGKTRGAQRESQWQNSVRHNLSMNSAFQRGSRTAAAEGKSHVWHLTNEAVVRGSVNPTTSHRKKQPRSSISSRPSAAKRAAGAKGGRCSKRGRRRSTTAASWAPPNPPAEPQPVSQTPFEDSAPAYDPMGSLAPLQPGDPTSTAEPLNASHPQPTPYMPGYYAPTQAPDEDVNFQHGYGDPSPIHRQQSSNLYNWTITTASGQQVAVPPAPSTYNSNVSFQYFDFGAGVWYYETHPPQSYPIGNHPYPQRQNIPSTQDGVGSQISLPSLSGPPATEPPCTQQEPGNFDPFLMGLPGQDDFDGPWNEPEGVGSEPGQ